jgi:cupin fold WbuC family metalloprotein
MIKLIKYKKKILGLIIDHKQNKKKVNFYTPNSFTQQVGYISHNKGTYIKPHTHTKFLRKIYKTSEVLYVKKGKIRVDFYLSKSKYLFSKIINKDKIIVLNEGSHGFKIIEKCILIEIKQGPFNSKIDKQRFNSVNENQIKIR